MNEIAATLLGPLLRTTGWLSMAALVVFALLCGLRCRSPALHRVAWCLVLVSGWLFLRFPVTIPWYDPPSATITHLPPPTEEIIETGSPALALSKAVTSAESDSDHRQVQLPWPALLAATWLAGIVVILARWSIGYWSFLRSVPLGTEPSGQWQAEWDDALGECKARDCLRLCITQGVGPLVFRAWGGHRLLVPGALWRKLSGHERMAVLRHELAHVARGDLTRSLAMRFLALPHWFNPVAWWAARNFDECGEWACDDAARRRMPADATAYARVLLLFAQSSGRPLVGAAIDGRRLSTRIKRLLAVQPREDSTMKKSLLFSLAALLVVMGGIEWRLTTRNADANEQGASDEKALAIAGADRALIEEMAVSAKACYEDALVRYARGEGPNLADVYAWSRRWLEAERGLARDAKGMADAMRAHRDRMKDLSPKATALHQAGEASRDSTLAMKYYLAEAEVWLAAADNKPRSAQKQEVTRSADPIAIVSSHETKWGTIAGRVVFAGEPVPSQAKIVPTKDVEAASRFEILDESLVVNPSNRGVRWTAVWIKNPRAIHPKMTAPPADAATLSVDGFSMVPHLLAMRQGQPLRLQNHVSTSVNFNIMGLRNTSYNLLITSQGSREIIDLVAEPYPMPVNDNIHAWMKSFVVVLDHPYFAATDENGNFEIPNVPAGTVNLVTWHETVGYGKKGGQPIEVNADARTEVVMELRPRPEEKHPSGDTQGTGGGTEGEED